MVLGSSNNDGTTTDCPRMIVCRVRTLATISQPAVRELVMRAVTATRYPGTTPSELYGELQRRIAEPGLAVFIGFEAEAPRALAIGMLPTSALMMAPQVALLYNGGSRSLLRMMAVRMHDWVVSAGYDRAVGTNLYRDDRVFMRGFAHFGKPARLGSMIEFRFVED